MAMAQKTKHNFTHRTNNDPKSNHLLLCQRRLLSDLYSRNSNQDLTISSVALRKNTDHLSSSGVLQRTSCLNGFVKAYGHIKYHNVELTSPLYDTR
jgi:hypothetical protein